MPGLTVVLADLDQNSREHARSMLKEFENIDVVAECDGVDDTIEAVCSLQPELLLLDVRLRGGCAFEVLDLIPSECRPAIMLTSVNDQQALKAFEFHVLDYFLKPINRHRLLASIDNLQRRTPPCEQLFVVPHSVSFLQNSERAPMPRLCLKTEGRLIFMNLDDVDWIEAAANYVRVHVGKTSYAIRGSIGRVAERLDASKFIRIHRSIIVNLYRISEVRPCNSGEFMVTLSTGKELSCSRNYRISIARLVSNRLTSI